MSVPIHIKDSLTRYVEERVRTGGFLEAVLANDLQCAVARADFENQVLLSDITIYVVNNVPRAARGSYQEVRAWTT